MKKSIDLQKQITALAEITSNGEAQVASQSQAKPNILDELKLSQALRLATKNIKNNHVEEAKQIFRDILAKFPKNKQAKESLARIVKAKQIPPQETINQLINLYNQGQLAAVFEQA